MSLWSNLCSIWAFIQSILKGAFQVRSGCFSGTFQQFGCFPGTFQQFSRPFPGTFQLLCRYFPGIFLVFLSSFLGPPQLCTSTPPFNPSIDSNTRSDGVAGEKGSYFSFGATTAFTRLYSFNHVGQTLSVRHFPPLPFVLSSYPSTKIILHTIFI